jgi:hypothetical protein
LLRTILSREATQLLAQTTTIQANATLLIIIIGVALDVVAIAAIAARERLQRLRFPFGPQYNRAVERMASAGKTEAESPNPSAAGLHARYAAQWRAVQAEFVDQPSAAMAQAGRLVLSLMLDRGYPIEGLDHPAADVSGERGSYVERYRIANEISLKNHRGEASTEELRQAIVHYRAVFDGLLAGDVSNDGQATLSDRLRRAHS